MFGNLADKLLLFPSTDPLPTQGLERKTIPFNNGILEIWIRRFGENKKANLFVLEFMGNAERAETAIRLSPLYWENMNVEVWSVNYPGFGGSSGKASLKDIPPSSLAAFDALQKEAVAKPIFIAGTSMGSTAALYVAAQRKVAGVILQNPPPLQRLIVDRHGWWNLWLLAIPISQAVPTELNSLVNAPKVKAPGIFIMAKKDTTVPFKYQSEVFDAYGGKKWKVELSKSDHNSPIELSEQKEIAKLIADLVN